MKKILLAVDGDHFPDGAFDFAQKITPENNGIGTSGNKHSCPT